MTGIAHELDEKLKLLDAKAASSLEKLVRDALELVDSQNGNAHAARPGHLPSDFFIKIAQEFGSEPLERPLQGEFEKRENW
jgi:hypothetical protein